MTARFPFRPEHRLRSREDFAAVYAVEFVAADEVLVVRACRAPADTPRLGLTVSRKVGNAVVRNRWKRRIREAFRLERASLPPLDLVVRPRKGAVCDFQAIRQSLPQLARRLERKIQRSENDADSPPRHTGPPPKAAREAPPAH